jgi:hypothetical protein
MRAQYDPEGVRRLLRAIYGELPRPEPQAAAELRLRLLQGGDGDGDGGE